MVFIRPHALLAAATLLQFTAASKPVDDEAPVTIIKTITNTHTVCPATTKPPVCEQTGIGGGHGGKDDGVSGGNGNGNGHGNGNGNGVGNGGNGNNGNGNGYHGGHKPQDPKEDKDLWQSWLDRLTREAEEAAQSVTKNYVKPTWGDNHGPKPTGGNGGGDDGDDDDEDDDNEGGHGTKTTTGKPSDPTATGGAGFDGQCTKPEKGKPNNECNSAADRSKWQCQGSPPKSIDSDYYDEYDSGKKCKYTLEITNTTLTYDAGPVLSFAVNGQSPGPLIECNWGDWVEIKVVNKLQNNATTIHWHGIHQKKTNDQDGVPGVSECGIVPGSSKTYAFRASSYGTAWYHAHLLAQYGDGIRGPIIIHGPATANYDLDMGTVMVTDTFPNTAFAQADKIAHFGQAGTLNYLLNGNNKAPTLATGKHALWNVQKGKKHLFRFINGAAQDIYTIRFDGHKMKVIAADFVPIVPYETEWLNIACGQRYDVIVEADQPSSNYFLRAVTQTSCPANCTNTGLGLANGIIHYEDSVLTLPNSTHGNRTNFRTCIDEPIEKLVPHLVKDAGSSAAFTAGQKLLPGGRVTQSNTTSGQVVEWFLNNNLMNINFTQPTLQTLADTPSIVSNSNSTAGNATIRNAIVLHSKNDWVYFVVRNQFFASHPMHIHGHDVSIIGQGNGEVDTSKLNFVNPIRRDTVMLNGAAGPAVVPPNGGPPGYSVIGFKTDNPGAWLMHCHIVWHVEGGMALQFIERPDDIDAGKYAGKSEFKDQCAKMVEYESNPANRKPTYAAGLKRDLDFDYSDVVRRDVNRHARRHI